MNTITSETILDDRKEKTQTTNILQFVDLPDDILFTIFSYCDRTSLGRVCCTCLRLRDIASKDCVWVKQVAGHVLMNFPTYNYEIINPGHNRLFRRSKARRELLKNRLRISRNWENKTYNDTQFVKHSKRLMPWLRLHDRSLYVSKATYIHCYDVNYGGTVRKIEEKTISGCNCDVTRFAVNDDVLVSGYRGGGIAGYSTTSHQKIFEYSYCDSGDTQTVAIHKDIVVAGFRNGSVKVINTSVRNESSVTHLNNMLNINKSKNRVWSTAIAPDGSTFSIGNAGHDTNRSPIEVHDLQRCEVIHSLADDWKRGAGILDIKYETPHTILTCGYDTRLRLWDLRTQTCVKTWMEPFDAELSCVQSDSNNVMVTGTFQYGVTRLWDKRLNDPVQLYYCGQRRSPVYSLDTDFQRLFVALDFEIHMLDFTI